MDGSQNRYRSEWLNRVLVNGGVEESEGSECRSYGLIRIGPLMAKSWKRVDLLINPELEIKSARFSAHLVLPEEMDAFFPPLFQLCVGFAERVVLDHFIVLDQSSVKFLQHGISHFDRCKNRTSDNP